MPDQTAGSGKKSFFLDTTILEACLIKVPVVSRVVKGTCSNAGKLGAAEYAVLEFHNAVVNPIGFVLDKVREKGDLVLVREDIDRVLGASIERRRANMCREILTRLELDLRAVFDPYYPGNAGDFHQARADRACALLRQMQKCWLRDLRRIVDVWERGTQCHWVRQIESISPRQPKLVKIQCVNDRIKCNLIDFLQGKNQALDRVRAAIGRLPEEKKTKELCRLDQAITEFKKNPVSVADYKKGCRCFADLLHVLQSDSYDAVYSMNHREFEPLCRALEKELYVQDHRGNPPRMAFAPPVPGGA